MFLYRNFISNDGAADDELTDILRNLQWILDTKRGSGYFIKEFGLTQGGFRTNAEIIQVYTTEIREIIELFEPRLTFIELGDDYDPETGRIKLEIGCKLTESGQPVTMVLDPKTQKLKVQSISS